MKRRYERGDVVAFRSVQHSLLGFWAGRYVLFGGGTHKMFQVASGTRQAIGQKADRSSGGQGEQIVALARSFSF